MEIDKTLIVEDNDGNSLKMEILFTFEHTGRNFVVYFDPSKEDDEVELFASFYDEDGNLYPIEKDEDWDIVEEMIEAFSNEDLGNE